MALAPTRVARSPAALAAAGWASAPPIQPVSTRVIDLAADEAALWGDLRKKWRQYVNKARTGGVRVVDAGPERLDEFYRIYRETADRAGFLIRAQSAYRDVWDAFGPSGHARLLFAELADGTPVATLFLVRAGTRVVEPYGGMTEAGADSRANYLLKWEAIRSSREQGATTYDLWGLAHSGIAHFKTGFGGREIALRRGVGPRARPARAPDVRGRAADPGADGAAAARPPERAGRPRGTRAAPGATTRGPGDGGGRGARGGRARRLGRAGRRRARRARAAVAGVGRAPDARAAGGRGSSPPAPRGPSRWCARGRSWAAARRTCRAARSWTGNRGPRTGPAPGSARR